MDASPVFAAFDAVSFLSAFPFVDEELAFVPSSFLLSSFFIVVFFIVVFLIVVFLVIIFLAIIRCVFYESGKIKSGDCFAYLCRSSICVSKYFVESCKGSFVSGYRISSVSVKISYSLINLLLKLRFVSYKNCISESSEASSISAWVASSLSRTAFAVLTAAL